jgi:hypothetical protein
VRVQNIFPTVNDVTFCEIQTAEFFATKKRHHDNDTQTISNISIVAVPSHLDASHLLLAGYNRTKDSIV